MISDILSGVFGILTFWAFYLTVFLKFYPTFILSGIALDILTDSFSGFLSGTPMDPAMQPGGMLNSGDPDDHDLAGGEPYHHISCGNL